MMKTNNSGIAIIKKWESCKLQAYKCPAGVWTIGYGHTGNVIPDDRITLEVADSLLKHDLIEREKFIDSLNLKVNENQFSALVSLVYNIGAGNFLKSPVYRLIRLNPNSTKVKDAFLKHVYAAGKKLPGLVNRRNDEIKLYYSPKI